MRPNPGVVTRSAVDVASNLLPPTPDQYYSATITRQQHAAAGAAFAQQLLQLQTQAAASQVPVTAANPQPPPPQMGQLPQVPQGVQVQTPSHAYMTLQQLSEHENFSHIPLFITKLKLKCQIFDKLLHFLLRYP